MYKPSSTLIHCNVTIFLLLLFIGFMFPHCSWGVTDTLSLDGKWFIATDAKNCGKGEFWFKAPVVQAQEAKVPWILQGNFPEYNGLVWYWKEFEVPESFQHAGRFLLSFDQVDYYAEIWLNDRPVGSHEGGEAPFVIDITEAIVRPGKNRLALRVLNPTHEMIDGITFDETPRRCKKLPFVSGGSYNHGGITGSVTLKAVPAVYLSDLFVDGRIDGKITIQGTIINALRADEPIAIDFSQQSVRGTIEIALSEGRNGETIAKKSYPISIPMGTTSFSDSIQLDHPKLWDIDSPHLYRVTACLVTEPAKQRLESELAVRFGFRDFRFENGYFRLNGKRIYLKSTHTVNNYPVGLQFPHTPDLWRRDLLNLKTMGFNMVRFIWGGAFPEQLDYCDEIGLLVYNESYCSHDMTESSQTAKRFHSGLFDIIKRDRNHPSIVIWGLLNEIMIHSPIIELAAYSLPAIRELDSSRMIMFNSGRWDRTMASGGMNPLIALWHQGKKQDPFVGINPTDKTIETLGIIWSSQQVALHPGPDNELSVVRWTAPDTGTVRITALFEGLADTGATTDIHIYHNDRSLFDSWINLRGNKNSASFDSDSKIKKGETIDFVVGTGNGFYGADSTGLSASIELNGQSWNLNDGFSTTDNPNGTWSFGYFEEAEESTNRPFHLYIPDDQADWQKMVGTLANPDSVVWEDSVQDTHPYQRVPHTADIIQKLRTHSGYAPVEEQPVYLSEYGIGSAIDLIRTVRFFEQFEMEHLIDAQYYRRLLDQYEADWKRWKLDEAFDRPEDFFAQSIAKMALQRRIGLNAIRSNPNLVGHNVTGGIDHVLTGEGLTTPFREMKPGTVDAIFDAWSPLRWSAFVEPIHLYSGDTVSLEVALTNEDQLSPGEYPARAEILDDRGKCLFRESFFVTIAEPQSKEPPFAQLCFQKSIPLNGSTGTYRFVVTLEKGGAAAGGEVHFYITNRETMPVIEKPVILWNNDPELNRIFEQWHITTKPFNEISITDQDTIIVGNTLSGSFGSVAELEQAVIKGATALFLCPNVFDDAHAFELFLQDKGNFSSTWSWLYLKDEWSKNHRFFEGLPSGGLMDNQYYRELISSIWFHDNKQESNRPSEVVAGAIKASQDYDSGLTLVVYNHGAGRIILNSFLIRENLNTHPAAERLLRNMIKDQQR